jgi:prepilin-type N-terminal cleavage/methylation domain-containing protein
MLKMTPIRGFTLVELMIGLVLTSVLLLGVGMTFASIRVSLTNVSQLNNAQEVLRATHQMLGRSLRSAQTVAVNGNVLTVQQQNPQNNQPDCHGNLRTAGAFTERFSLQGNRLMCQVNNETAQVMVTGVLALQFNISTQLADTGQPAAVRLVLAPAGLPARYPQRLEAQPALTLDFALKTAIVQWAT